MARAVYVDRSDLAQLSEGIRRGLPRCCLVVVAVLVGHGCRVAIVTDNGPLVVACAADGLGNWLGVLLLLFRWS